MKTLKGEWEQFKKLIPPDAGAQQLWDMEVAFYAGAMHLHDMLLHNVTPGDEVQQADLQMMANLEKEFNEFDKKLLSRIAAKSRG